MEIFLLFVSHCVPNPSIVNSFLKNTQTQFLPIFKEFAQNIPSLQKSFSCKRKFSTNLSILTRQSTLRFRLWLSRKSNNGFTRHQSQSQPYVFLPHCNYNSIFATFLQPICKLFSLAFSNNSCSSLFLQISIIVDNNKLLHLHNHQVRGTSQHQLTTCKL